MLITPERPSPRYAEWSRARMANDDLTEEWRPVVGREPQYLISSSGRLKTASGRYLKLWKNDQGYVMARLSGPRTMARVHRLVAAAFVPNPDGKPDVNHLDCDRANNVPANLEWCTQAENLAYARSLDRMPDNYWRGRRSPSAALSDDRVREIRAAYAEGGESWESIAKRFGISKRSAGRLINGETYADVV
jgi:hypothetical protein